MSNIFLQSRREQRGFTLIEMMVSISIFAIVAVVAIGALLKIVDANKKAQSLETSINNLNFILDSMTREMRVGSKYNCIPGQGPILTTLTTAAPCPSGVANSWVIEFNSSKSYPPGNPTCNLIYAYYFDMTSGGIPLQKAEQKECGPNSNNDELTPYPLISNDAGLDSAITFSAGTIRVAAGDTQQPFVQLYFRGSAGARTQTQSTFDLQTTISQRLPD